MRSERVETNRRCNQNCTYCTARRPTDDMRFVQRAAVVERVRAAIRAGAREIALSGGEPTLRNDLPALTREARAAGAERVVLETNATAIDDAEELKEAGLDRARVNLAGDGPWIDAITRDPGGFTRTLAGVDALLAAGIAVDVQAAIVRSTAERLAALPPFIATRFGGSVRTLFLVVPTDAPAGELLDYDAAGAVIRAVDRAARRCGVPVKLAPGSGPPPCVHGEDPRVAHLYALTAGARDRPDHARSPTCERCAVRDRCPGVPRASLERFGWPSMTPVRGDRARRRLSLIATVEEQVARELVTHNRIRDPIRGDLDEDIIRVVFQCNQSCRFCFVSTHLPKPDDAAIESAIRAARGRKISLSGGEPSLHPRLLDFVRLARSLSERPVLLQTNAVRLAEGTLAAELRAAGLDEAFVSLHGATADVSDAVTDAPGTFARTVLGLDALERAGVRLQINFVLCQANLHELPAWVRLVAARWPDAFANVSFVAPSTDVVPRDASLVPRYSDVAPVLAEAVTEAQALGVELGGFESMCGIPLCLLPRSLERYFDMSEAPPDAGEFVKPSACARCALASRCFGIRRGYRDMHGDAELSPVDAPAPLG